MIRLIVICLIFFKFSGGFAFADEIIKFSDIFKYAELSSFAYKSDEDIRNRYGEDIFILNRLEQYDGNYFVIKDDNKNVIVISIRGTANIENAVVDAEFMKVKDDKLGIYLHDGFKKSTDELYINLKDQIIPFKENYIFEITGHSLGGAMAAVLMMYMQNDGFLVEKVITFGQPKVTNKDGVEKFGNAPLLRVSHEEDPVPLLPAKLYIPYPNGHFEHFGEEVILLKGSYFSYLDEAQAEEPKVSSWWANIYNQRIGDHSVIKYVRNIEQKLSESNKLPYVERFKEE